MERYLIDEIYNKLDIKNSAELILEEQAICDKIEKHMEKDEYIQVEERLYEIFMRLEREGFHKGFIEGIRFLLKCL